MHRGEHFRLDTQLSQSCPYFYGQDILNGLPERLQEHALDRCFVITSKKLLTMFAADAVAVLRRRGVPCETIVINETEANKNWETLSSLCEELVAAGATKDSILLAFGGGVIGNLVGLAAGLLYRGVRFVEVPTTVLSQTDGTISNKQAINGLAGKNQFGIYHAPLFIWADFVYPRGEPPRQRKGGVVEGIKNVLISHSDVTAAETMITLADDPDRLAELLPMLIESKLEIVRRDPTEREFGVALEYGHTFGHAIEWLARGRLFHGEAVAIGICMAAQLSRDLGYMSNDLLATHRRLFTRLGVPTKLPAGIGARAIHETILRDNKRSGRGVRYVLLKRCGELVNPDGDYMVSVPETAVLAVLERFERNSFEWIEAETYSPP